MIFSDPSPKTLPEGHFPYFWVTLASLLEHICLPWVSFGHSGAAFGALLVLFLGVLVAPVFPKGPRACPGVDLGRIWGGFGVDLGRIWG